MDVNKMTPCQNKYYGASGLLAWAGGRQDLQKLDETIAYVLKDKLYYYFEFDSVGIYTLICTSEHDLGEMK